jgi:hypothetical protein
MDVHSRSFSAEEALKLTFSPEDVYKITEVHDKPPDQREALIKAIAEQLKAHVCVHCMRIHYKKTKKCLLCAPSIIRRPVPPSSGQMDASDAASQVRHVFHQREQIMNEAAIELARQRQELVAAGYTRSDEISWMEHLRGIFGYKSKRREETDVVYMPDVPPTSVDSSNNTTQNNNNAVSATTTSTSR